MTVVTKHVIDDDDEDCHCGWTYCCCFKPPKNLQEVRKSFYIGLFFIILGMSFMIIAALLPSTLNNTIDTALRTIGVLSGTSSTAFPTWIDNTKVPLTISAYLFHIVNPDEILQGAKPAVLEKGPYVYGHNIRHFNVSWSQNDELLSYRTHTFYRFIPELSVGDPTTDLITSVNVPFSGVTANLYDSIFTRGLIDALYGASSEKDRLFTTKTVHELFFGYNDTNLAAAGLPAFYSGLFTNYSSLEASYSATYLDTIYTGVNNLPQIRQYKAWQEMEYVTVCPIDPCGRDERIPAWVTLEAGKVEGSDGSQFPPPVSLGQTVAMFFPNLFRKIKLLVSSAISFKGMSLLRLTIDPTELFNSTQEPENAQYYQNWATGIFNTTSVSKKVPVFQTKPHFLDVGASVADEIEGLNPIRADHDWFVDVEPQSGTTFRLYARSQVNVKMNPLDAMPGVKDPNVWNATWFKNIRTVAMPVFWASDDTVIDDADALAFKDKLNLAQFVASGTAVGGFIFGALFLLIGSGVTVMAARQRRHVLDCMYDPGLLYRPDGLRAPAYHYGSTEEDPRQVTVYKTTPQTATKAKQSISSLRNVDLKTDPNYIHDHDDTEEKEDNSRREISTSRLMFPEM